MRDPYDYLDQEGLVVENMAKRIESLEKHKKKLQKAVLEAIRANQDVLTILARVASVRAPK